MISILFTYSIKRKNGCPRGVVANVLEGDIVESQFKLQSHHYVHFRTNTFRESMNPVIPLAEGLIVLVLFFNKDGFFKKTTSYLPLFDTFPNTTF